MIEGVLRLDLLGGLYQNMFLAVFWDMFWLCCAIYSVIYSWVCSERGKSDEIQMEMKSENVDG